MAKRIRTVFTVEGRGQFPIDMLRHDACWPHTSLDASVISTATDRRRVQLITDWPSAPTHGRWDSFLWPVVEEEKV